MTDPSRREIWKMFDLISPTYDRVNRILSMGMDQRWRKRLIKHLPAKSDLELLDLATGTGDQLIAFVDSSASIRSATGIDLSQEMMQIGLEKLKAKPYRQKVEFLRADAENLPFPENRFDAASFSFGIRNVTTPLSSLKEVHRVLKPKGRALILEFSLPKWPIKSFYLFYLRHLLPRIGGLVSRAPAAYRYLNETIETFPSGKKFCDWMQQAGFQKITRVPMALGAVTLYIGEKG